MLSCGKRCESGATRSKSAKGDKTSNSCRTELATCLDLLPGLRVACQHTNELMIHSSLKVLSNEADEARDNPATHGNISKTLGLVLCSPVHRSGEL